MPIQLSIWERRDNGEREAMGNIALAVCRAIRKTKGITSSRYYWSGYEQIVFLTQGEAAALSNAGADNPVEVVKLSVDMLKHAKNTLSLRLTEPQTAVPAYQAGVGQ